MTKSINQTVLNPNYIESLNNLWNASMDMLTYSSNILGEIYRISSIVRLFARQKAKIDALRQMCAEGSEKGDIYLLNKVAYLAERSQEEKAFDQIWVTVSKQYDEFIEHFIAQQQNDNILVDIPTSEEIMDNCTKSFEESRANKLELAKQSALAMISL